MSDLNLLIEEVKKLKKENDMIKKRVLYLESKVPLHNHPGINHKEYIYNSSSQSSNGWHISIITGFLLIVTGISPIIGFPLLIVGVYLKYRSEMKKKSKHKKVITKKRITKKI